MIRLFAAVEIPESVRLRLTFLQGGVPGARWSPPENLHLTLRFIGDVDEVTAGDIDEALGVLQYPAFEIRLRGAGEFGGRDPHALWAGVAPCPELQRLVAKIERALQRLGRPAETRKYAPHVTLARLRDPPLEKVQEFLAAHSLFDSGPIAVKAYSLFSSHQTSKGSLYRVERTYALDG
ncbi:MAG: RNA 2',3'-cyclic phosphodiesterase [Alphaproteobacteria bacterium]|nr:RNA 2',3'-cyclic phosphodiesterase [Alphaproteobacteria bacterium]